MCLSQYFSDVLLLMYVFPYYYSALMASHTVLHVDTVLVAVALMIMTSLGPSPGLGRHIVHSCLSHKLHHPVSDRDCCSEGSLGGPANYFVVICRNICYHKFHHVASTARPVA